MDALATWPPTEKYNHRLKRLQVPPETFDPPAACHRFDASDPARRLPPHN